MADHEFRSDFASGNPFKIAACLNKFRQEHFPEDLRALWPSLESFNPTVVLAGGISTPKGLLYSFDKTIPYISVDLQVVLPLSDKAPVGLPKLPFGTNKLWVSLLLQKATSAMAARKKIIKEVLDIDMDGKYEKPAHYTLFTDIPSFPSPHFYGVSTTVITEHPEWPKENFYPCGFFTIGEQRQEQLMKDESKGYEFGSETCNELTEFLAAGSPPVYLGWGSIMCNSPQWMVSLALEALQHVGARGVLLGGWAGLSEAYIPDHLKNFCKKNVIFVSSAPHEWLFPQCSCIVHHGGAGTTAASIRSGRPTVITPVMGDQFDFAAGVNEVGCGIGLRKMSSVRGNTLGDAIKRCLEEESIIARAKETGEKLRNEDGCETFCNVFEEWLVHGFASGEWLRKHENLMKKCKESWEAEQRWSFCFCR
ncbi:unnamed protein product [Pseudo-nitzschia multistriata]|uniref:Erythromycin biosynthesis protein CIII-like C-terminal domain-containing protein n=1 Tax=Pseudo-nitzschia multistriata TaxID=183589 RepID=A0A448Z0E7_9STRA|nr:unnamed protein product [Pseudo-nitzschia multistriata]